MDNPFRGHPGLDASTSTIALATWFQFGPGEQVLHARLESRMLLWCVLGEMRLRLDGEWREFRPDDWLLLPWGREVLYRADRKVPCLVGSIHLIPHHDLKRRVEFQVSTQKGHPLAGVGWRKDLPWPALGRLPEGHLGATEPLRLLGSYVIKRFQGGRRQEAGLRVFAGLLLEEIGRAVAAGQGGASPLPAEVRRIQEFASTHIQRKMTVAEFARIADVSKPTVHRLFRDFLKTSPYRWLSERRIQAAQDLLRTTNLPIAAVGERVGVPDPFHFSRFFKENAGVSPKIFRQRTRLF